MPIGLPGPIVAPMQGKGVGLALSAAASDPLDQGK